MLLRARPSPPSTHLTTPFWTPAPSPRFQYLKHHFFSTDRSFSPNSFHLNTTPDVNARRIPYKSSSSQNKGTQNKFVGKNLNPNKDLSHNRRREIDSLPVDPNYDADLFRATYHGQLNYYLQENFFKYEIKKDEPIKFTSEKQRKDFISKINAVQAKDGRTLLHLTCMVGYQHNVEFLLSHGANPFHLDIFGYSLLHVACMSGNVELCKYLLLRFPDHPYFDPNFPNREGRTCLHIAITKRITPVIDFLLKEYPQFLKLNGLQKKRKIINVTARDRRGDTVVHYCSGYGDLRNLKLLISHSKGIVDLLDGGSNLEDIEQLRTQIIDLNEQNNRGETPLHSAVFKMKNSTFKYLIDQGVELSFIDSRGRTPLHLAISLGLVDFTKALLERGTDPYINLPIEYISESKENSKSEDIDPMDSGEEFVSDWEPKIETQNLDAEDQQLGSAGRFSSVLHSAAKNGQIEMVEILISQNYLPVDYQDYLGKTPLHHAAYQGYLKICKLLYSHGSQACSSVDITGSTPLHAAIIGKQLEIVLYFLLQKVPVDASSPPFFRTPLHTAVLTRQFKVCQLLIEAGANLNLQDRDGWTALHHAAWIGSESTFGLLLSRGADFNLLTNYAVTSILDLKAELFPNVTEEKAKDPANTMKFESHVTPLHLAINSRNQSIVRLLLPFLKDPEQILLSDSEQWTYLHYAIASSAGEICQDLISHLTSFSSSSKEDSPLSLALHGKDIFGNSALHFAAYYGHPELCILLLQSGASLSDRGAFGLTPFLLGSLVHPADHSVVKVLSLAQQQQKQFVASHSSPPELQDLPDQISETERSSIPKDPKFLEMRRLYRHRALRMYPFHPKIYTMRDFSKPQ